MSIALSARTLILLATVGCILVGILRLWAEGRQINKSKLKQQDKRLIGILVGVAGVSLISGTLGGSRSLVGDLPSGDVQLVAFPIAVLGKLSLPVGSGLIAIGVLALALIICLLERRVSLERARLELLQRSEERLRALVYNTSDIITVVTLDGIVEYTSPSIERILGYKAEAWSGKKWLHLVHPEDGGKAEQYLQTVMSVSKADMVTELRFRDAEQNWRIFEVIAHNLLADPSVKGVVVTCHNITQHRQREERLRLMESVVVHANDSVLITEAEPTNLPGPRIVYVNEAFVRHTGYTLNEILGKTPRILQGSKSDRATLDKIRAALEQWQPIRTDILNYRKDRTEFWAELSIFPVADESGWFTHWISIQRDITVRKHAEEETRKALIREKELRELKSRFVSMVSHEFRTPLATILASSDLLKSFGHKLSPEKKQERLNKIQTEVKNMTQLLDDILLIGKVEAGRVEFKPVKLDLQEFCQDIADETHLFITDRHRLVYQYQGESFQAEVDEKLLRHILTNLLSNAIKYSPQGGTISLKLQCESTLVTFRVQDSGLGIPKADLKKLFEAFHRASNVDNISGTGLGLAIVEHATRLQRGQIRVKSQLGSGSTFTVTIPRFSRGDATA